MNPTEEAIFYITKWYPSIGMGNTRHRISGLSTPGHVMNKAAKDMLQSDPSDAFPDRYKEHIAFALKLVADGGFLTSSAAVGSVYLATRFEYYFRILSDRLKGDGTWKSNDDRDKMESILQQKLPESRVNSVALAYKIMTTNKNLPLAQICQGLDKELYSEPRKMPDGKIVSNIGERILYIRNRSAHGNWGDISSEADFYGVMTVIVFYNQNEFQPH